MPLPYRPSRPCKDACKLRDTVITTLPSRCLFCNDCIGAILGRLRDDWYPLESMHRHETICLLVQVDLVKCEGATINDKLVAVSTHRSSSAKLSLEFSHLRQKEIRGSHGCYQHDERRNDAARKARASAGRPCTM